MSDETLNGFTKPEPLEVSDLPVINYPKHVEMSLYELKSLGEFLEFLEDENLTEQAQLMRLHAVKLYEGLRLRLIKKDGLLQPSTSLINALNKLQVDNQALTILNKRLNKQLMDNFFRVVS